MICPETAAPASSRPPGQGALSRRELLLRGGGGLLALAVLGGSATGCGVDEPPEPDPLEAELAAARRDSGLAAAAAAAAPAALRPALSEVAAERSRHATALVEELARAAGKPTPTESETESAPGAAPSTAGSPSPGAPTGPPPGVRDVVAALKASAERAGRLTPTLSGYRAGLMGSIAAACTTTYTVGLPEEETAREKRPK